jgi:two-component system chemotaxis response regulator CheY
MRTLIVEDDLMGRRLLEVLLAPLGACVGVAEGGAAVACVEKALVEGPRYDLVCLDLGLPNMDGNEVLQRIRGAEQARGTRYGAGARVVVISGKDDTRSVSRAFGGMCDAYLVKPVVPARLFDTLDELGCATAEARRRVAVANPAPPSPAVVIATAPRSGSLAPMSFRAPVAPSLRPASPPSLSLAPPLRPATPPSLSMAPPSLRGRPR